MTVNTKKVTDRRKIRFESLDDLRAETQRIAAADRAGTLRRTGNWTAGQCFHHLATWIGYAYTGAPPPAPPFFVRWIGPFMKKTWLQKGFPVGVRMPVEGGTHGVEVRATDEGERELLAAIARLDRERLPDRHPVFGAMTKSDWVAVHLRHAELHYSFLLPR